MNEAVMAMASSKSRSRIDLPQAVKRMDKALKRETGTPPRPHRPQRDWRNVHHPSAKGILPRPNASAVNLPFIKIQHVARGLDSLQVWRPRPSYSLWARGARLRPS